MPRQPWRHEDVTSCCDLCLIAGVGLNWQRRWWSRFTAKLAATISWSHSSRLKLAAAPPGQWPRTIIARHCSIDSFVTGRASWQGHEGNFRWLGDLDFSRRQWEGLSVCPSVCRIITLATCVAWSVASLITTLPYCNKHQINDSNGDSVHVS